MIYEIPPDSPRRSCAACSATIVMVVNATSGRFVPVSVATSMSHFADCTEPDRFRRRRKNDSTVSLTAAARKFPPVQAAMFE